MRSLRLAIVGAGIAARDLHWPALQQLRERYEIVAVTNPTRSKAEAFADLVGVDRASVHADVAELLARDDVDVVDIVVPPQFNWGLAEAAAAAGKHVIVEKPIANTLEDARAIVDLPGRYRVQVFVAENFRYQGFLDKVKELVDAGAVGTPFLVSWRFVSRAGPDNKYANTAWRQTPEHPGGFLGDVNVHTASALRYLAGEVTRVHCLAQHVRPWLGGLDTAVFNLQFTSGVIGNLAWALASATDERMQFFVHGTEGTVEATWDQVTLRRPGRADEMAAISGSSSHANAFADFYEAMVNGKAPRMTTEDGLRDLAVVLAAVKSVETGQAVDVEW